MTASQENEAKKLTAEAGSEAPESGVESREAAESEVRARKPLLEALRSDDLDPHAKLEVIAAYEPEIVQSEDFTNEFDAIVSSYGVSPDDLPPDSRETLAVLYLGAKEGRNEDAKDQIADALEKDLRGALTEQAFGTIEALKKGLDVAAGDPEKISGDVERIMDTFASLAKQLPRGEKGSDETWAKLHEQFTGLVELKKGSRELRPEVHAALNAAFEKNAAFIEDELVAWRLASESGLSAEAVTQELYGRTPEEVEQVKSANRTEVVAAINRMAKEPALTVGMLEELHALNNKGIVPKEISKLRENPDALALFKARLGLFGSDVRPEMEAMMERANQLYADNAAGKVSDVRYDIETAKLHNDLLDMHPFGDRNGSTGVILMELLQARKGKEPSPERPGNYYVNVTKILNYNPLAVVAVGGEHRKIAKEYGYYEGATMTPEKKKMYDMVINAWKNQREAKKKKA